VTQKQQTVDPVNLVVHFAYAKTKDELIQIPIPIPITRRWPEEYPVTRLTPGLT